MYQIQEKCGDDPNVEECLRLKFQKKEIESADCRRVCHLSIYFFKFKQ